MSSPDPPQSIGETTESGRIDSFHDDETAVTEMTFLPDGRICLFGASREILELLGSLRLGDASLNSRLAALASSAHPSNPRSNSLDHA